MRANRFRALRVGEREFRIASLEALEKEGPPVSRLPYSLRILLENLLRREDGRVVSSDDLASDDYVKAHGLKPRARVLTMATYGAEPVIIHSCFCIGFADLDQSAHIAGRNMTRLNRSGLAVSREPRFG